MFGFGKVIDVLRNGDAVARQEWYDGQRLVFVPGSQIEVAPDRPLGIALGPDAAGHTAFFGAHIDLVTVVPMGDDTTYNVVVWTPTVADLLAEDWDYVR